MEKRHQPLPPEWVVALLGESLRERLAAAHREMEAAVNAAREHLGKNPLTKLTARELTRLAGRRTPDPNIGVTELGDLFLDLEGAEVAVSPENGAPKRSWKTELPGLETLRERARTLGVNPDAYGRNKRKLQEAIQAAERPAPEPTKVIRRKMVKHAPALAVTVLNPEGPPPAGTVVARLGNAPVDMADLLSPRRD